ncbi:hypothetical protein [Pseudoalteromonas sp. B160]
MANFMNANFKWLLLAAGAYYWYTKEGGFFDTAKKGNTAINAARSGSIV